MGKRAATTRKIELVETHNIALALVRLTETWGAGDRWKRAFYHALAMSNVGNRATLEKIRIALELP
jgi:hypothetical protein